MDAHTGPIRFYLLIPGVIALFSCTRPSTVPESGPISPQESAQDSTVPTKPLEKGSPRSWKFSATSEPQHYNTTETTTIQQSLATSTSTDSITTSARYTLSVTRSASLTSFAGSIDTFSRQAGNQIGFDLTSISFPVSFTGEIQNHELKLDVTGNSHTSESSPICALSARSTFTVIRRNLYTVPPVLETGMTWQDSISTTSCKGLLELNLTSWRTYTVIGESTVNGKSVLEVDIKERTLSTGEGSQDQHRLIVQGDDTGSGQLYLDDITGSLVSLSFENHTTLHIQSSGRQQQFLQNSRTKTNRI